MLMKTAQTVKAWNCRTGPVLEEKLLVVVGVSLVESLPLVVVEVAQALPWGPHAAAVAAVAA